MLIEIKMQAPGSKNSDLFINNIKEFLVPTKIRMNYK
jgi:hypothetical protein